MNMKNDQRLEWDDVITVDYQPGLLLDEGDYDFSVVTYHIEPYAGPDKAHTCQMAVLTLQITVPGKGYAHSNAYFKLDHSNIWLIDSFFRSIKLKSRRERYKVNWEAAKGCCGRAHFRPYQGKNGLKNSVAYFIDPEPMKLEGLEDDHDMPV